MKKWGIRLNIFDHLKWYFTTYRKCNHVPGEWYSSELGKIRFCKLCSGTMGTLETDK